MCVVRGCAGGALHACKCVPGPSASVSVSDGVCALAFSESLVDQALRDTGLELQFSIAGKLETVGVGFVDRDNTAKHLRQTCTHDIVQYDEHLAAFALPNYIRELMG